MGQAWFFFLRRTTAGDLLEFYIRVEKKTEYRGYNQENTKKITAAWLTKIKGGVKAKQRISMSGGQAWLNEMIYQIQVITIIHTNLIKFSISSLGKQN